MEWLTGFVLGILADLFRSVFLPATTEQLERLVPGKKKAANRKDNFVTLEMMERLKSLGLDPQLAQHMHDDSDAFLGRLVSQRDAYIDASIVALEGPATTQIEMNVEALRRADVAEAQLNESLNTILAHEALDKKLIGQFEAAQAGWENYRDQQVTFAGLQYEGGSMRPLIEGSEREALTLQRVAELKAIQLDFAEKYG